MVWSHSTPPPELLAYHRVPDGWSRAEMLSELERLGGTYRVDGPDATEPGAPSWMPDRYNWLQYRETLVRIAQGVRAGDQACIELAVRFIILRYIGSYSGFVRQRLARALKSAPLTRSQADRLHAHFTELAVSGVRTQEYRELVPLWRTILNANRLAALRERVRAHPDSKALKAWWLPRLCPDCEAQW